MVDDVEARERPDPPTGSVVLTGKCDIEVGIQNVKEGGLVFFQLLFAFRAFVWGRGRRWVCEENGVIGILRESPLREESLELSDQVRVGSVEGLCESVGGNLEGGKAGFGLYFFFF
mmetsp:Transcript_29309/g.57541  ORF Transcript_29309/g.57541 Transcript_29309/m.57541 type:complete len:116 (-) Transcript_29309:315-662(-)